MDWTTSLKAKQNEFITRLKLDHKNIICNTEEDAYSELIVISDLRLKRLRDFCWSMTEKYRYKSPREVYINNMKGKLGEEAVAKYLKNMVREVDYLTYSGGDGKVDLKLISNPEIGIQVKVRYGNIDTVKWEFSKEEVSKNVALVCILLLEQISEAQTEYNLVMAGFLPTEELDTNNKILVGLDDLLYGSGLHSYLQYISSDQPGISSDLDICIFNDFIKASECLLSKNYKEAILLYTQIINIKPDLYLAYHHRGNAYYLLDNYEAAIDDFRQIIHFNPHNLLAYLLLSSAFIKKLDYQAALEQYKIAIILNNHLDKELDILIYIQCGWIFNKIGNYEEAIENFNEAINCNNNDPQIYNMRGRSYYELSKYEDAFSDFTQAIELDSDYVEAYSNRSAVSYRLKNYRKALQDSNKALKIDPSCADAYLNRGQAREGLKQYKGAIQDYTKSISFDPGMVLAYNNRGLAKYEIEDYQGAIEDCTEALKLDPNCALAYNNRGLAMYEIKDYHRAIDDCNQAIKLDSKLAQSYYIRGKSHLGLRNLGSALSDIDQAIQINPEIAEAYTDKGFIHLISGRKKEAIQFYKISLHLHLKTGNLSEYNIIKMMLEDPKILDLVKKNYFK